MSSTPTQSTTRRRSTAWLGLALLGCFLPSQTAAFATSFAVLRAQASGVIPNAIGPIKAKVSSAATVLTIQFGLVAGTGYGAGTVTTTTNAQGQVLQLAKGRQTCSVAYNTAGTIKTVTCSTSRRKLGKSTPDPEDGEEGEGQHQGRTGADAVLGHRRLASCSSCVTLVRTAFSTKIKALCGSSFSSKVPSQYPWAPKAALALCSMTTKLEKPGVLANKTCRCCLKNADCTSGVCSVGVCLNQKIGNGGQCPDRENQDCQNGACARASFPSGSYVCCPSNVSYFDSSTNATYCKPLTASPIKSPVATPIRSPTTTPSTAPVATPTFQPSKRPTKTPTAPSCLGDWPDPSPIDIGDCKNRSCYSHGSQRLLNDTSTVFLSNSLPGVGSYECRYTVTTAVSQEGGCMTIVPKYDDAVVMALSRYRRLSPCHIQASWIVSSTYDRTQYGYPYVRMNWDSDWESNYTVGWYAFPASVCGGANKVSEFHSFQCFYSGYCHPQSLSANAYNNCYFMNGYNASNPKTSCSICDYTKCL